MECHTNDEDDNNKQHNSVLVKKRHDTCFYDDPRSANFYMHHGQSLSRRRDRIAQSVADGDGMAGN